MLEIAKDTVAIGMADPELPRFENQYPLTSGVTYNSYLITSDGVCAVIDSVDSRCGADWMQKLAGITDHVDYIVVQHMEPDHSGTLGMFMERYPDAKIVASAQALKMIERFFPGFPTDGRTMPVKEGDTLAVGQHTLRFIAAPMVHWPEVIMTFDSFTGTMFTADAFGTFGTETEVDAVWPGEARRYYTNIVGKYGPSVKRVLAKIATLENIVCVAPLHGPLLRGEQLRSAWNLYSLWCEYKPEIEDGVLVAYASIYGNTARTALKIADDLRATGRKVATVDLCDRDVSEAVAQAFRMGTMVLAASTYDAGLFPPMYNFLHHLQTKALRGRRVALVENGSWAPVAAKVMREMASELPATTILEPVLSISSAIVPENDYAALISAI